MAPAAGLPYEVMKYLFRTFEPPNLITELTEGIFRLTWASNVLYAGTSPEVKDEFQ